MVKTYAWDLLHELKRSQEASCRSQNSSQHLHPLTFYDLSKPIYVCTRVCNVFTFTSVLPSTTRGNSGIFGYYEIESNSFTTSQT